MNQLTIHLIDGESGLLRSLEVANAVETIPISVGELIPALELANYLYVIGRCDEAKKYLLNFIYFDCDLKDEVVWNWNGYGIAILAALAREEDDPKLYASYQNALQTNDGLPSDRNAYVRTYIEKYNDTVNHMKNHADLSDNADFEDSCEYLCDVNMQLRYFYELLFKIESPNLWTKWRLAKLKSAYIESDHRLKKLVLQRAAE